jgi:predicted nucleic acid-binding protein
MAITGAKRESLETKEYPKKVGLFDARVIAINPDAEWYNDELGIQLKEDSKATIYLGVTDEGVKTLRVDIWLQDVKSGDKFKTTFYLKDKAIVSKSGKTQFITDQCTTSYAESEDYLQTWFIKRDYHVAREGEPDLCTFLATWTNLNFYEDPDAKIVLEWKDLMKGNVSELRDQIEISEKNTIVALATVKVVETSDGIKEYQSVFNKAFMPSYALRQMRQISVNKDYITRIGKKLPKELKVYDRFILKVAGEYGCKDFYTFTDLKEYNAADNFVASDKVIADDDDVF